MPIFIDIIFDISISSILINGAILRGRGPPVEKVDMEKTEHKIDFVSLS